MLPPPPPPPPPHPPAPYYLRARGPGFKRAGRLCVSLALLPAASLGLVSRHQLALRFWRRPCPMMPVCSLLRPHMCAPAASPALLRMLPPLGPALPAARRLPCASPPLAACGSARCLTNRAFKEIQDEAADKKIVRTPTLFRPLYSAKDVGAVKPVHFKPQTFSDRVASIMIHLTR